MPQSPLSALSKAQGIQPTTSPGAEKLEKVLSFLMGAAGLPDAAPMGPDPDPVRPPSQSGGARRLGEVLAAAVPFSGARVFRAATPAKMLKPNAEGFLNFAEDAAHSSAFATEPGSMMMPATLDVQHAIDLTPEALGSLHGAEAAAAAGDVKQLEGFIPPEMLSQFKKNKTYWRGNDPDARYEGRQGILSLVEQIQRKNPNFLKEAGFDGMRYIDGATPAWAALDPSQVKPTLGRR